MKIDKTLQQFANTATQGERLSKPAVSDSQASGLPGQRVAGLSISLSTSQPADAPVDAARVQEIKAAIREGRFAVDSEKIADKLLSSVQELLAGRLQ
jgi:negative regulator of flagellin synthesis FlgM